MAIRKVEWSTCSYLSILLGNLSNGHVRLHNKGSHSLGIKFPSGCIYKLANTFRIWLNNRPKNMSVTL